VQEVPSKRKLAEADTSQQAPVFQSEVVFGIPWACKAFMQQACRVGHPSMREGSVPRELVTAVDKHVEWNAEQMASYRIAGCRCWIVRAKELEDAERLEKASRGCKANQGQTSALTREILQEMGFADVDALKLLAEGATLAGEIEASPSFEAQYKPCLTTMQQLEMNAGKMNEAVARMTTSSGDPSVDEQLLDETLLELQKDWADGPCLLHELEEGATVSRRFPLAQGAKTRMIDDFSISGVTPFVRSSSTTFGLAVAETKVPVFLQRLMI
jgi:hypothetical protein